MVEMIVWYYAIGRRKEDVVGGIPYAVQKGILLKNRPFIIKQGIPELEERNDKRQREYNSLIRKLS